MSDHDAKTKADGAESLSTAGLGAALSNAELADAIEAAYQRVRETGRIFSHYPILEKHLGALLEIQRGRAVFTKADAQIFAAAPDMLEALTWVVDNPTENAYWMTQAIAAIEKARGCDALVTPNAKVSGAGTASAGLPS